MKHILSFFLVFCTLLFATAQESHEFVGVIKLNDSSLISLKIMLKAEEGKISGYTLTDLGGEHETKSSITGFYNEDDNVLVFKELATVYTKSPVSEADFCYMNFTSDNYRLGKSNKLTGKFKGLFPDNTVCINGELLLSTVEKYNQRVEKATKMIAKTKRIPDSVKQNINLSKMMDSVQMNVLKSNQVMSVFSKSKTVRIEIYDGGQLDGDRISLKANDKTLLTNFETKAQPKVLNLELKEKKTALVLTANNTGSISTNTAVIEIFVDGQKIRALSNLKTNESTQVDLYLKQ
ncbi:hypothetical protein [Lacinutrix sp. Hel_I_90]|uniref:hypothetical protein n=1 Tax=Lacinutrix sp. Hel_I_90 TaxID=1249999 RepID=UPI0005C9E2D3|nr:hypothetical protein [Lacinutrix sp. Hel_I_90]